MRRPALSFPACALVLLGVPLGAAAGSGASGPAAAVQATAGTADPDTDILYFYQDLAWSPDGKQIVFSSIALSRTRWEKEAWGAFKGAHYDIEIVEADGSSRRRLTDAPGDDMGAAWSPDGRWIVFSSERDGEADLYVMDANGRNVDLLASREGRDASPCFSPDGARIVYASRGEEGRSQIHFIDADGSNATQLTHDAWNDWNPVWSPDGKRILFYSDRAGGGKDRVVVIGVDGTGEQELTTEGNAIFPSWSPDGKRILFGRDDGIEAMDAAGGGATRLRDEGFFARWSPDGQRLAWIAGRLPDTRILVSGAEGKGEGAVCITCPR